MNPGIYAEIPMSDYLAAPAASASLIKKLMSECPRAAWADSWLNPARENGNSDRTDRGSIAHAILLEGSSAGVTVIDPQDHPAEKTGAIPEGWTNKSIRTARDQARADGKIPVLLPDWHAINDMVTEAHEFIASLEHTEPAIWAAFQKDGGASEETVIWQDGDTLCKMRPDRRSADWSVLIDYKTTERSVEPSAWGRSQLIGMGYYLSAAWYRRGVLAACGVLPDYVFLAQEVEAPYLCSLVGVDPAMLDAGSRMIDSGLQQWERCVKSGHWPAYPARVCYPEAPAYMLAQWEEQQVRDIEENGMPADRAKKEKPGQWLTRAELESGAI